MTSDSSVLWMAAGLLWVLPALGPEGRLFAGVAADRTDNIVAVAADPASGYGPLYAAVRCGAELLDRVAPAEAAPYRAHWLRAAGRASAFDAAFPADAVLAPVVRTALERYPTSP